jgi:hypothetical protein
MPILHVVLDPTVEVSSQPDIVKTLLPVKGIDSCMSSHHFPEPFLEKRASQ